jgi:hypothetical protein
MSHAKIRRKKSRQVNTPGRQKSLLENAIEVIKNIKFDEGSESKVRISKK